MRLCGAQERELRRARQRGELPGARSGPLPILPARLPATSDVSIVHLDAVFTSSQCCLSVFTVCLNETGIKKKRDREKEK